MFRTNQFPAPLCFPHSNSMFWQYLVHYEQGCPEKIPIRRKIAKIAYQTEQSSKFPENLQSPIGRISQKSVIIFYSKNVNLFSQNFLLDGIPSNFLLAPGRNCSLDTQNQDPIRFQIHFAFDLQTIHVKCRKCYGDLSFSEGSTRLVLSDIMSNIHVLCDFKYSIAVTCYYYALFGIAYNKPTNLVIAPPKKLV